MADKIKCELNEQGLLPPNCFNIQINEFKEKFVEIKHKPRRKKLFNKFLDYQKRFDKILIKIWINGSYTTSKRKPGDMDLAVHYNPLLLEDLSIMSLAERELFKNRSEIHNLYECHTQLIPVYPENHKKYEITLAHSDYWNKWFKDVKNKSYKKGFVELDCFKRGDQLD